MQICFYFNQNLSFESKKKKNSGFIAATLYSTYSVLAVSTSIPNLHNKYGSVSTVHSTYRWY